MPCKLCPSCPLHVYSKGFRKIMYICLILFRRKIKYEDINVSYRGYAITLLVTFIIVSATFVIFAPDDYNDTIMPFYSHGRHIPEASESERIRYILSALSGYMMFVSHWLFAVYCLIRTKFNKTWECGNYYRAATYAIPLMFFAFSVIFLFSVLRH